MSRIVKSATCEARNVVLGPFYENDKDGKTARQLLVEQPSLLEQQMQAIANDVHAGNIEALQVYGKFLAEKFGKSSELSLEKT